MKLISSSLVVLFLSLSLYAQGNYDDYIQEQSKKYKTGGIAMLVGGTLMIGGGVAMISNSSDKTKVMGAVLTAGGVAIDVASIFIFKKRKQLLEDANKDSSPISLYLSPNSIKFTYRF